MGFLSWLSTPFRWMVTGVRWLFGVGQKATKWPRWVHRLIRYSIILLVTVLLCAFSTYFVERHVVWTRHRWIQEYWLGLLFLATCFLVQMLVHLIYILRIRPESEFPDIDQAWQIGMEALEANGINIFEVPVFLVAGLTEREDGPFRTGAGLPDLTTELSRRSSPLRFFGDEQGVLISCPGISAISAQAKLRPAGTDASGAAEGAGEINPNQTQRPGAMSSADIGHTFVPGGQSSSSGGDGGTAPPAVLSPEQLTLSAKRLAYFSRLLRIYRDPRCPINGLLCCLPFAWCHKRAIDCQAAVRQDIALWHRELSMVFPVSCLLTGLELLTGVSDFLRRGAKVDSRFGPGMRAGSRFPVGTAVDQASAQWVAESSVEWFRSWVYHAFAQDVDSRSNPRLYRLLCEFDERQDAMGDVLRRSFGEFRTSEPIRLVGCYYSGHDATTGRMMFVKEVVQKLKGHQNDVTWSPERVRSDRNQRAWAGGMTVAALGLAGVNVWLIWQMWQ